MQPVILLSAIWKEETDVSERISIYIVIYTLYQNRHKIMTIGIVRVTDKNFRITIPEEIRDIEDIKQGDYIRIDVEKLDLKKPSSDSVPKPKKITNLDLRKSTFDSISELNRRLDELPEKIADAIKKK